MNNQEPIVFDDIPGDKSIAHRALIFAALKNGSTVIRNMPLGLDVLSTIDCLNKLGVEIDLKGTTAKVNSPGMNHIGRESVTLDCGNSGTTMRLLCGVLAHGFAEVTLVGDESLSKRPMARVVEPLRSMGAKIEMTGDKFAPVKIYPAQLKSTKYELPIASAQVKSALMLAGYKAGVEVTLTGKTDSRNHTELMLAHLPFDRYQVPADFSSASFMIAASLLTERLIEIQNLSLNPTRLGFLEILKQSGCHVEIKDKVTLHGEQRGTLIFPGQKLTHLNLAGIPTSHYIDELPLLMVLAATTHGVITEFRDLEELKHKESDRLQAVRENLLKLGVSIQGHVITGSKEFTPAKLNHFHDHRILMSFEMLNLAQPKVASFSASKVHEISYPQFYRDLNLF